MIETKLKRRMSLEEAGPSRYTTPPSEHRFTIPTSPDDLSAVVAPHGPDEGQERVFQTHKGPCHASGRLVSGVTMDGFATSFQLVGHGLDRLGSRPNGFVAIG